MPTKHLCVLIHIRIKGEVDTLKQVYALQYFYWPFQGGTSFVIPYCYQILCFMFVFVMLSVCSLQPCDHLLCPTSLLSVALCCVVLSCVFCHSPIWYLSCGTVSIPDLCLPLYFLPLHYNHYVRPLIRLSVQYYACLILWSLLANSQIISPI